MMKPFISHPLYRWFSRTSILVAPWLLGFCYYLCAAFCRCLSYSALFLFRLLEHLLRISALGLSINVISLAGLAFAVGMVVDASIVSLENIFRLRQSGQNADQASYDGARQVWAPILGSAVTTVVVFLPIIILQLPVGQLFRDIGVAISVAVMISVLVSVTVIPALSSVMLKRQSYKPETLIAIPVIDDIGRGFKAVVLRHANVMLKAPRRGVILIGVVFMIIIGGIMLMMPKLDYLPDGNANFVFGRISVPPGYSVDETLTIASAMEKGARPLWEADPEETDKPAIERFFFVAYGVVHLQVVQPLTAPE